MKKVFTAIALALVFVSCKKEIDELPPDTQTGANTFGAKVNGDLWAPQGFGPFPANDILESILVSGRLTINARNFASSPNETEFVICLDNVTGPGTYQLNANATHPSLSGNYGYYVKRRLTPLNEWITSSANTGSVTITKLDIPNKIVAGTFQFNALNLYNTPEPLTVTEGRFDLKMK
jgi:hypothetical protein